LRAGSAASLANPLTLNGATLLAANQQQQQQQQQVGGAGAGMQAGCNLGACRLDAQHGIPLWPQPPPPLSAQQQHVRLRGAPCQIAGLQPCGGAPHHPSQQQAPSSSMCNSVGPVSNRPRRATTLWRRTASPWPTTSAPQQHVLVYMGPVLICVNPNLQGYNPVEAHRLTVAYNNCPTAARASVYGPCVNLCQIVPAGLQPCGGAPPHRGLQQLPHSSTC